MTDTRPGALPLPVVPGLSELSVLARGGYATVYRATQVSVAREVAVKVENRTLDNERDQRRFLREARAAGRMSSHPHVVDLFDAGVTADQHPYLIMELCDGSYAERMRKSPLTPAEARDIGVKIADALADAHQLGVLHRDVKPANILCSRFGEPALADFGLAILAETRDSSVTLEVLTPAYAPPEMFRHSAPSPAVDVYALCATLYAVMRGKPPRWHEDRNPSLITLVELFNQPVPDLPGTPPALMELLRRGMSNDPTARPSAAALRDSLGEVSLAHVPAPPASQKPTGQGVYVSRNYSPPAPTHGDDSTPTVPSKRGRGRLRWWLAGLATLVVALMVSAGTWYAVGAPGPDPTPTAVSTTEPIIGATSLSAGGALPGCLVPINGGRCPEAEECYGPVSTTGGKVRAEQVPCAGRHTWESYAIGDLPSGLAGAGLAKVKADPAVKALCSRFTFSQTTLIFSPEGWQFEVLPGEGDFRCLAGKGTNALTGHTLGR
ncbi:serine/threonine-protein kinase [Phytohabitans aurantiacus]|uniref:serine/threonine-protein kinase n=1 Tax=Phytohabitans aurantiacus TaxID=3016789 RepID=UPI0024902D3D|nr:serine/threonine-protein kinase [Phytohabitans aurantiacus]